MGEWNLEEKPEAEKHHRTEYVNLPFFPILFSFWVNLLPSQRTTKKSTEKKAAGKKEKANKKADLARANTMAVTAKEGAEFVEKETAREEKKAAEEKKE